MIRKQLPTFVMPEASLKTRRSKRHAAAPVFDGPWYRDPALAVFRSELSRSELRLIAAATCSADLDDIVDEFLTAIADEDGPRVTGFYIEESDGTVVVIRHAGSA